jgi:outer membrane protein TolC
MRPFPWSSLKRATVAAGFAAALATPAAAADEVLTIDEAVRLALANNLSLDQAAKQVDRAEQQVLAARTRRLPNLKVEALAGTMLNSLRMSFPQGAFGSYEGIGPVPGTDSVVEVPRSMSGSLNATLAQPITQLHRIGLNTKLSELTRDHEKEKLREQRAAVVADVRRLYYTVLHLQSGLSAKEEQLRAYRELDRLVGQQVAIQVALRADGMEVKSRLAAEEYELATMHGDLATAKEQLNYMLGRDVQQDFTVAAVAEATVEELDLPIAMSRALERRPDVAQARLAIEQADTDRRLKKAESIPEVSLALTYYSFANVDLLPRNLAQVGIQVKWEPFDWGRRGKEQAEKTIQLDQARTAARQAQERARLEVAQTFRKLREARLLIEAERLGRDAAREKLRVLTVRHDESAALVKDVLEAQATMSAADARYDQALAAFWTARADFQKAIGEEL